MHRVLAYRNGAKAVREAPVSVAALAREGRATELAGIGDTLQQKIRDLADSGTIPATEKLRARYPDGLLAIMALPGVGPKRTRRLFDELGVDSLESLRAAAEGQRLRTLKGFGERFETAVLAALDAPGAADGRRPRWRLDQALELADAVIAQLRERDPQAHVELAGSARRRADSVKDLDIVIAAERPAELLAALAELDAVAEVLHTSESGARAVAHSGLTLELRAVAPDQLGNVLQHLTGSAEHNAALRERAVRRGLHVSEYGVSTDAGETHRCATEEEVYALIGLPYIEPELRENRGEIDGPLPQLIDLADIRGDLHCHTVASDGHATIEEMAAAARALGYEYLVITDHSATHGFGNDVPPQKLREQVQRIRELNEQIEGIELLAGSEVNILPDGSPDYDDELLASLDWAIGSVHTSFSMGSDAMTARLLGACEHPLIDAIGHPTGRLIERRAPYELDMDALFAACARTGTILEINANPARRDLSDVHARAACAAGAQIAIDSDAHRTETLQLMRYGVWTARRAWLTAADVVNTLPWPQLRERLKRAGAGAPARPPRDPRSRG